MSRAASPVAALSRLRASGPVARAGRGALSPPSAAPCAPPAAGAGHGGCVGVALRPAGLACAPRARRPGGRQAPWPARRRARACPWARGRPRRAPRPPHAGRERPVPEEGGEVRVRANLPGHGHGPRTVLGAVRPRHGAVHVGPGLPDAGVAPGALAGVAHAAGDAALRAGDRVAAPPGHPGAGLVGTSLDLLELGPRDLPGLAQPHRAPEERRQHPRVPAHTQPPWSVTA